MCTCEVCVKYEIFKEKLAELLPSQQEYFSNMYDDLTGTQYDLDFYKHKVKELTNK